MKINIEDMAKYIDMSKIRINEPMSKHTTFRLGGVADALVMPETIDELTACLKYAKENKIPVTIIGNGSKLLVLDGGIRGIVIKLASRFANITFDGNTVQALSGVTLPYLAGLAKRNSLSGLEFACGIPATLGGAIFQNAGAYDGDMSKVVEEVTYLDEECNLKTLTKDELQFGYRNSFFKANKDKGYVIVSAKLRLVEGNLDQIEKLMNENTEKRNSKQPLEYPSAGSVFKRPEGYFVGKLIDDAGLKGKCIGDAQISTKHSGFIVNKGNATSKDVLDLINFIKKEIFQKFGVKLEEEIIIIGDEK